jgi:hypothetical protein
MKLTYLKSTSKSRSFDAPFYVKIPFFRVSRGRWNPGVGGSKPEKRALGCRPNVLLKCQGAL